MISFRDALRLAATESPTARWTYVQAMMGYARLLHRPGHAFAAMEAALRAWRADPERFSASRKRWCRRLIEESCFVGGSLGPVSGNRLLAEYARSSEADEIRREFSNFPDSDRVRLRYPRPGDDPERQGDLVVLKAPVPSTGEKGVILVKYTEAFRRLAAVLDLAALADQYQLVLEPSWWGYQDATFLLYLGADLDVVVLSQRAADFAFIEDLDTNLVPIRLGAGDWVDGKTFEPVDRSAREFDVVMVAGWSPMKRHGTLFRALRRLRDERGRTLRVALIGYPQGWSREKVESLMIRYGVKDQCVVFEGIPHAEVARIVARSRVSVILSRREGANKALYESLFCDTPVIVLRGHRGINLAHVTEKVGLLTDEGDLAETLLRVIDRPDAFGPREWALANTGWERSTEVLNDLLAGLAERRGRPWTTDVEPKTNAPNLVYARKGAYRRFERAYADLAAFLRPLVASGGSVPGAKGDERREGNGNGSELEPARARGGKIGAMNSLGDTLRLAATDSPPIRWSYVHAMMVRARLLRGQGRTFAATEAALRAWRADPEGITASSGQWCRRLIEEKCFVRGTLGAASANGLLAEYARSPEAEAIRREFRSFPVSDRVRLRYPRPDDDPERQGDLAILKAPVPTTGEKGVIYVMYTEAFRRLAAVFDLAALAARYQIVLEPSWWGYQDATFLLYLGADLDTVVLSQRAADFAFIEELDTNLVPVRLGAGDWVDGATFESADRSACEFDVAMVAGWTPMKRHSTLFRALRRLRDERGRRLRVALIGYPQGWSREKVESLMSRYGVSDQCVVFEGIPHEEVARIVARSRVSVILSRREGANRALYESLFCDTPVVVIRGHRGINLDHITERVGLLTDEGDLAETLLRVIDRPEAFSPREWALAHTGWERSTEVLNRILAGLADQKGRPWTTDIEPKKSAPNLVYARGGAYRQFEGAYAELEAFLRP